MWDSHDYEKIISTVGRLNKQKNYDMLLHAFERFQQVHDDYILKIYGVGEEEEHLKKLTKTLNIEGKVFFEGFRTDIHYVLKKTGMFVMSSDYEGLSNALLEAMAMGIPCISTDSPPGGARMVIQHGENGLLVPVGDVEELAQSMKYLVEHSQEAQIMGNNALKLREQCEINHICNQWMKLIQQI
jgi:glycosyltransferase involved in cell wall biosynthesis